MTIHKYWKTRPVNIIVSIVELIIHLESMICDLLRTIACAYCDLSVDNWSNPESFIDVGSEETGIPESWEPRDCHEEIKGKLG